MTFYPTDRVALFIDGANLYSAAKALNFDIDYKKLLDEFRKRGVLIRAYYYTAIVEGDDYSPIRPLVDWLDYNGYSLVTKAARQYTDSQGRKRWRGDMDVEIAVDMMEIAPHVDHVVLFSGDGDFRKLVQTVQSKGVRVTVVSTVKSQPPMASDVAALASRVADARAVPFAWLVPTTVPDGRWMAMSLAVPASVLASALLRASASVVTVTEAPVSAARRSAAATTAGSGVKPSGAAIVTWMPAVTAPSIRECAMLLAPSPK